jgi:chromosome segregation ATPase
MLVVFYYNLLADTIILILAVFPDADQVAELETTIESLESQLEEQSSAADNVISEWQESYSALEVRSSELETQLETLRQEKQELSNAERSISVPGQSAAFEELRSQKERLENELRQLDEALSAARQDLQDAEDAQEWEGKSLGLCECSYQNRMGSDICLFF